MVPTLRRSPLMQNHDTRRVTRFCPEILMPLCTTWRPDICMRPCRCSGVTRELISPKSASKQLTPCFPSRGRSAPHTRCWKARSVSDSVSASPESARMRSHLHDTSDGRLCHTARSRSNLMDRSLMSVSHSTWMKRRSSRRVHRAASCSGDSRRPSRSAFSSRSRQSCVTSLTSPKLVLTASIHPARVRQSMGTLPSFAQSFFEGCSELFACSVHLFSFATMSLRRWKKTRSRSILHATVRCASGIVFP
mmetsp:Transcript_58092/g.137042  ORF Transcript_58092/g.137042 Transcript_58092/m.137042 type:complete len:249 (-) Transcript_58092:1995-2741(-)